MIDVRAALHWLRNPVDPAREYSALRESVRSCALTGCMVLVLIVLLIAVIVRLLSSH